MDTKVKGLVLASRDYGEKDKLVTILTLEKGKITCKARGVKAPKSKLKMQVQPFCFADFELVSSGNNYTLTGGNIIDSFFDVVTNMDKFEYGYGVLEILDKVSKENEDVSSSLVLGLKVLKELCYGELSPKVLFLYFMLNIFRAEGFELNTDRCSICKSKFMKDIYLNISTGELVCKECRDLDSLPVPPAVFSSIRLISSMDIASLGNIKIKDEYIDSSIMILKKDFESKFMCKLNSINM